MSTNHPDKEDRLEQHCRRLGTHEPRCVSCGEPDPRCLEDHHLAGRQYHSDTYVVCRNCHRKLSDDQRDHPTIDPTDFIGKHETIGHFLLGLCDLLMLIVERLREFAHWLINEARKTDNSS